MPTKHTAIVAAFVAVIFTGIALPDSTNAYTPIEEFYTSYDYITPRDAEFRAEEQRKVSEARRNQEQETNFYAQHPVKGDERALARTDEDDKQNATEASATDIINALTQLLQATGETPNTVEERRNERLIERLTLHAGAPLDDCRYTGGCAVGGTQRPLAKTGAGTVVAMMILLGAGVWTVKRSGRNPACRQAGALC